MNIAETSAPETYLVVMNDEEQYSIWPERKEIPAGWTAPGPSGTREECLEHIKRLWTDMRPRSLRMAMEAGSDRASTDGP